MDNMDYDKIDNKISPSKFSAYSAKFDGSFDAQKVNEFIRISNLYVQSENVSDDVALRELDSLLIGRAKSWWEGIKKTVSTWKEAINLIKNVFSPKRPAFQVYMDIFNEKQDTPQNSKAFLMRKVELLSELKKKPDEETAIDLLYGLLHSKIRENLPRESVATFQEIFSNVLDIEAMLKKDIENKIIDNLKKRANEYSVKNLDFVSKKARLMHKYDASTSSVICSSMKTSFSNSQNKAESNSQAPCGNFNDNCSKLKNKRQHVSKNVGIEVLESKEEINLHNPSIDNGDATKSIIDSPTNELDAPVIILNYDSSGSEENAKSSIPHYIKAQKKNSETKSMVEKNTDISQIQNIKSDSKQCSNCLDFHHSKDSCANLKRSAINGELVSLRNISIKKDIEINENILSNQANSEVQCSNCNGYGHLGNNCLRPTRFPATTTSNISKKIKNVESSNNLIGFKRPLSCPKKAPFKVVIKCTRCISIRHTIDDCPQIPKRLRYQNIYSRQINVSKPLNTSKDLYVQPYTEKASVSVNTYSSNVHCENEVVQNNNVTNIKNLVSNQTSIPNKSLEINSLIEQRKLNIHMQCSICHKFGHLSDVCRKSNLIQKSGLGFYVDPLSISVSNKNVNKVHNPETNENILPQQSAGIENLTIFSFSPDDEKLQLKIMNETNQNVNCIQSKGNEMPFSNEANKNEHERRIRCGYCRCLGHFSNDCPYMPRKLKGFKNSFGNPTLKGDRSQNNNKSTTCIYTKSQNSYSDMQSTNKSNNIASISSNTAIVSIQPDKELDPNSLNKNTSVSIHNNDKKENFVRIDVMNTFKADKIYENKRRGRCRCCRKRSHLTADCPNREKK